MIEDDNVTIVNINKAHEERVLRHLDSLKGNPAYDQRMVSIAYTSVQEAFMWANRAIWRPGRVALPEDAPVQEDTGESGHIHSKPENS